MQPWEASDPIVSSATPPAPAPWEASDPIVAAPPTNQGGQSVTSAQPSLGERFMQDARAALHGSLLGHVADSLAARLAPATMPFDPNTGQPMPGTSPRQQVINSVQGDQEQAAAMPGFMEAPGVGGKIAAGASALAGNLAGGLMSPESLVPGVGLAEKFAAPVASPLLQIASRGLGAATEQAAIQGGANVAGQGAAVAAGTQDKFDTGEAVGAAAFGGGLGGAFHILPELANVIVQRVRDARASKGLTPAEVAAPVEPADLAQAMTHEDVDAIAKANGVTDPNDPRVAKLRDLLEPRRIDEAGRETRAPSSADATSMRTADEAIEAGAHPSAVMPPGRDFVPGSGNIQVTPSGQAIPLDSEGRMTPVTAANNDMLAARGNPQSRALVPTEPQPVRMTDADVAAAQARNAATDNFEPNENGVGRLFTDQGGGAEAWQHPAGLLTHDTGPTPEAHTAFAQRVQQTEGNNPAGQNAPGAVTITPEQDLRPAGTEPQPRLMLTHDTSRPMTDAEVDAARAHNARSDNFTPTESTGRLFTDQTGNSAPWQYPAGLLTHDASPTESERVPHSQAVMAAEGNNPAGQEAPGRISILPDDQLRPSGGKPSKPGDTPPGQPELPQQPTPMPPWLRGEEAPKQSTVSLLRDDKPTESPAAPIGDGKAPAPLPESSPAPGVEALPAPSAHEAAWTKARDTAAARAAELQAEVDRLRALRQERSNWNYDAEKKANPDKTPMMPGHAEFMQGRPGDQALLSTLRGKERGVIDATGRQKVAEAALADIGQNREPPFSPSYPKPLDNQAVPTAPPDAPNGVIKTIQSLGGIKDTNGDLRAADLHKIPGVVNNKTGMGVDTMSDALADRGFFPELKAEKEEARGGPRTLNGPAMMMDAIKQEQSGRKITPTQDAVRYDAAAAAHDEHMSNVEDAAKRLGLAPNEVRGITRGQLADLMADRHSADELAQMKAEQDAHLEAATEAAMRAHDDFRREGGELPVDWEREASQPATQEDVENGGQPGTGEAGASSDAGRGLGEQDAGGAEPAAGGDRPLAGRALDGADESGVGGRAGEEEGGTADAVSRQGEAADKPGAQPAARDPLRKSVEDDGQTVLPGAEASTKQAIAARQDAPLRGKVPQADTSKFDLFDPHARDQGKLATDAAKAADDISGKLFAGPTAVFDPAMWKFMFGPIKRGVLQPFADSFHDMSSAFSRDSAKAKVRDAATPRGSGAGTPLVARVDNALPRPVRAVNDMLRTTLYGNDSALRAAADRLPAGSRAAAHSFLDLFHARAGEARAAGRTYAEGVAMKTAKMTTDLETILKGGGKKLATDAELAQVVKMVQNPRSIRTGTRLGDMADGITKWLADAHKYQTDAGVDMGKIAKGYFPRRFDVFEIAKDRAGFLKAAEREMRASGAPDPAASAHAWLSHIMSNGTDKGPLSTPHDGMGGDHFNGRALSKNADETLRKYLINDPARALVGYARAATRTAEYARVMGKDDSAWTKLTAAMKADGAESAIPRFADYVNTMTGSTNRFMGGARAQKALGWMRLWGSMGLMAHSAITSLPEVFSAGSRTGNLADVGRQVKMMGAYWMGTQKGVAARQLAEDVGTVTNHLVGSMASARWVGDLGTDAQNALSTKYFRMSGLEQWSQGMNTAATSVGDLFVRRTAGDIGSNARDGRAAAFSLAELGVPREQHAAFSTWIKSATNGGKDAMTPAALAKAPKAMADAYRTAVFRFTRQVHMMPNAATRPGWASTPLGAMAFHLSNYTYAVHTNILMRAVRMMKDGDMTGADKLIVGAKIAMSMIAGVVASKMIGDARDALLDSKSGQQSYDDHAWEMALSRGQMMGAVDPWYQILTGITYHRDLGTYALGPAGSRVLGGATAAINETQGIKSSQSETHKNVQAIYDAGVMPTAAALSAFLPAPLGAAIIQYGGMGSTRDAFTDAVAGPSHPRPSYRRK